MAGGYVGYGGLYALTSTEVFIPDTGKTCRLSDLPQKYYDTTMNTLGNTPVICNGGYNQNCLQFTPTSAAGVWTDYANTTQYRYHHSSWVSSAGLVLMGGARSYSTQKGCCSHTTEIVQYGTIWPTWGLNFTLVQETL